MTALDRKRREAFIDKAIEIHGERYLYHNVIYINSQTKVEIICRKHGSFYQTTSNHLKKCGCPLCKASKGENLVRLALNEMGVLFKEQQKFPECIYTYPLPFDFYAPKWKLFIEYHGLQHYNYIPYYHKDMTGFIQQKERDLIKKEYATQIGIYLEIPYQTDTINGVMEAILKATILL